MEKNFLQLTNAVYKILEFLPESDPLKNRAKDRALAIMSRLSGIPSVAGENSIQEDIDILLGYLWIGKTQGWLNSANYLIITSEYEKITLQLRSVQEKEIEPTIPEKISPMASLGGKQLSDRQEKILEFLNKNEKAQVMDLKKILPSVTKRTIRRDLDELLESGKIVRFGDFNQVFYQIKHLS